MHQIRSYFFILFSFLPFSLRRTKIHHVSLFYPIFIPAVPTLHRDDKIMLIGWKAELWIQFGRRVIGTSFMKPAIQIL